MNRKTRKYVEACKKTNTNLVIMAINPYEDLAFSAAYSTKGKEGVMLMLGQMAEDMMTSTKTDEDDFIEELKQNIGKVRIEMAKREAEEEDEC